MTPPDDFVLLGYIWYSQATGAWSVIPISLKDAVTYGGGQVRPVYAGPVEEVDL